MVAMHAGKWALALAILAGTLEPAVAQESGRKLPTSRPVASTTPKEARRPNLRRPTTLPASATNAVRELAKEFEVGKLRSKSDYFAGSTNADLPPEVVAQLLNRPLGESDSMEAYIKWQLLSAMPKEAPEGLAGAILDAYRNAPGLQRRPGIDPAERRTLDRELRKADDPTDLSAQLDEEVRRADALNQPVMAYRDALFACLPDEMAVFEAAMNDIYERSMAGISPGSLTNPFAVRATRWIGRDATDAEVRQLSGMLRKLLAAQVPDYYDGVRRDQQDRRYAWVIRRADPNVGGRLQDLLAATDRRPGSAAHPSQGEVRPAGRRSR